MSELLTTVQAAQLLGVSTERIRQLIARKELPAIRPGREYLIERAAVEAFERRPVGRPRGQRASRPHQTGERT